MEPSSNNDWTLMSMKHVSKSANRTESVASETGQNPAASRKEAQNHLVLGALQTQQSSAGEMTLISQLGLGLAIERCSSPRTQSDAVVRHRESAHRDS